MGWLGRQDPLFEEYMNAEFLEQIHKKVEVLALPLLVQGGIDLIELKVYQQQGDVLISIVADKPLGGITMGECAQLNRALVEIIDQDSGLGNVGYALEFSSPGLDRPLSTVKDFMRNLNHEVHFWLKGPVEGKQEWSGILMGVTSEQLTVFTKKKQQIILSLGQIIKAVQVF